MANLNSKEMNSPVAAYEARIAILEAEKASLQSQHAEKLKLIDALNAVDKHIATALNIDELFNLVLNELLPIFSCERAWIITTYKHKPDAKFYHVAHQAIRADWCPDTDEINNNLNIPFQIPKSTFFEKAIDATGAMWLTPSNKHMLVDPELCKRFSIRSSLVVKINSHRNEKWLMGIHHCKKAVAYNRATIKLFETLSERISNGLECLVLRREKDLFENTGISMWHEDFSVVYNRLNLLRKNNVKDLGKYIQENSHFPVDMAKLTKVFDVNQSAVKMFGAESKKQLIKSIKQIFPPTSMGTFAELLCAIFDKKKVFKQEVELYTLDGSLLNAILTFQMPGTKAGFLSVPISIIDITSIKQAELKLEESEKRYRSLYENSPVGYLSLDENGKFLEVNQSVCNILGYKREEIIGSFFSDLLQLNYREKFITNFTRFKETGISHFVPFEVVAKNKRTVSIEFYQAKSNEPNAPLTQTHCVLNDISDLLNNKEALRLSNIKLQSTLEGTISATSKAIELRDPYTAGHQRNVADLSQAIAKEMNFSTEEIKGIFLGASIHDIGKIQVPAEILCKPKGSTALEYQLIQTHSQAGYEILGGIEFPWPIADIIRQHHERMDGSGYPSGLEGDQICIEARIVAVADVVEAMYSHRPYRPGLGIDKALQEIQRNRGTLYDKSVVDACLKVFKSKGFSFTSD